MRIDGVDLPDRVEQARDALRVELAGQHRLIPRRGHERHRGEVVDLVRPHFVDDAQQRQLIEQVGRLQRDAIEQVLDAPEVRRARAADGADDLVALLEQQLGEVRAVLPGDSGDERALGHSGSPHSICCISTGSSKVNAHR